MSDDHHHHLIHHDDDDLVSIILDPRPTDPPPPHYDIETAAAPILTNTPAADHDNDTPVVAGDDDSSSPAPTKSKKKTVTFPDGGSAALVSFISSSTPTPTSHRRLHSDAVFVKFIEFIERGRPSRRFIREGLFTWRQRLFGSKKQLVVHLFSDVVCLSRKNADGYLYLLDKYKLKQCRVELDQMTITITSAGSAVTAITASSEHVAKGWFNDLQALCVWCRQGEAGLVPVVPSPDLEIAFASAHARSISVALRDEFNGGVERPPSHFRSTSAMAVKPPPTTTGAGMTGRRRSVQRFEMSWEYAVDQMNLRRSVMKRPAAQAQSDERAGRQRAAMDGRLAALRAGDFLLKYDRAGGSALRFYRVDAQGEILSWAKAKTASALAGGEKRLEMASLSNVVLGPQTKRFQRYLKEGRKTPWLCFSLIPFSQRAQTIDLECSSAAQFDCWVLGLQSLIPLWQSTHITHGHLLWIRTMMHLDFIAMQNRLRDRADALRFIEEHPQPTVGAV